MEKGWVALGGTVRTDVVALWWGQWGQMWWHRGGDVEKGGVALRGDSGDRRGGSEVGTLGTDVVALRWGHRGTVGGTAQGPPPWGHEHTLSATTTVSQPRVGSHHGVTAMRLVPPWCHNHVFGATTMGS